MIESFLCILLGFGSGLMNHEIGHRVAINHEDQVEAGGFTALYHKKGAIKPPSPSAKPLISVSHPSSWLWRC